MECVVEPEEARHPVSVPRREERRGDPREVREDRHSTRQHKGHGDGRETQRDPDGLAEDGVRVHMLGATEEADENELGCGMGVDRAGSSREVGYVSVSKLGEEKRDLHEEVDHADAEANLGPYRRQRKQSRRGHGAADVDVYNHAEDSIEGCCESLQYPCSLYITVKT